MLKISESISTTSGSQLALVPFITAGYPNFDATLKVIDLLDKQGAQAIELGIPYSDALADGVVIQEASRLALKQKTYIDQVLMLLQKATANVKTPIIIFTYFNPVLSRGIKLFIQEIAYFGAKGLIVPDLPLEESEYLIALCAYYNIELILFISPNSSEERIQEIVLRAPGCIYLVSSYGVTGFKHGFTDGLKNLVRVVKQKTDKCIMLGFGISSEKHVNQIIDWDLDIDALVIGTAFINKITASYHSGNYDQFNLFCSSIKNAISAN